MSEGVNEVTELLPMGKDTLDLKIPSHFAPWPGPSLTQWLPPLLPTYLILV